MTARHLTLAALLLTTLPGCHAGDPLAGQVADFHLPAHFEALSPQGAAVILPEGSTRLVRVVVRYDDSLLQLHDLRVYQSVLGQLRVPPGLAARVVESATRLERAGEVIVARHLLRLTALDAPAGATLTMAATAVLRPALGAAEPIGQASVELSIQVSSYQPTAAMLEDDRRAALYYLRDALSRYDQLLRQGRQLPWDTTELEGLLDQAPAGEAIGLQPLVRARQRADEARRHLAAAARSPDPSLSGAAARHQAEVDQAFAAWKERGVPPPQQVAYDGLRSEGGLLMPRHHFEPLKLEQHFSADPRAHGASRLWLPPQGSGLRYEGRLALLGPAARRSTALVNTLGGHLALTSWWIVEAQLPLLTLVSSTGEVWQSELLNPALTIGFVLVERSAWRLRLNAGYAPDLGLSPDLRVLGVLTPDMSQWSNVQAHSLDLTGVLELAFSQYTFALALGGQSIAVEPIARGGEVAGRFSDPPFAVRYDLLTSVWVVPDAAIQIDARGLVFTTGAARRHLGAIGLGGHYNVSPGLSLRLGLYAPYGRDAAYSSFQLQAGLAWTSWGALFGG